MQARNASCKQPRARALAAALVLAMDTLSVPAANLRPPPCCGCEPPASFRPPPPFFLPFSSTPGLPPLRPMGTPTLRTAPRQRIASRPPRRSGTGRGSAAAATRTWPSSSGTARPPCARGRPPWPRRRRSCRASWPAPPARAALHSQLGLAPGRRNRRSHCAPARRTEQARGPRRAGRYGRRVRAAARDTRNPPRRRRRNAWPAQFSALLALAWRLACPFTAKPFTMMAFLPVCSGARGQRRALCRRARALACGSPFWRS